MLKLHRTSVRPRRVTAKSGFSLVELLVSITIFIILATLALSAFRDSKHDKVASASRQISASIGGARSRASKAVEPRGVRLLRDKQDYSLISGLQYVGQSQLFGGGTLRVQMDDKGVTQLLCVQAGEWTDLRNEGLLKPGAKVFLWAFDPTTTTATAENANGGRWYTIASSGFAPAGEDVNNNSSLDPGEDLNLNGVLDTNEQRMQIIGPVDGAKWIPAPVPDMGIPAYPNPVGVWQYAPATTPPNFYVPGSGTRSLLSSTIPMPYLLRLSPQELADAEPINLPPGMVIELNSSRVPASWTAFEDRNQNGTLDVGEDLNGNGILDDVNFDIPVSPNGTVGGAISGSGPIYLYVCTREDVDRMRSIAGYTAGKIPGDFENGNNGTVAPYTADFPSSERKLVCIIPQTGLVYMAEVNGRDSNTDGWADDPYSFARAGREGR